jgi:hypothetical protein
MAQELGKTKCAGQQVRQFAIPGTSLDPPLVSIVFADEKPNDHPIALHTKRPMVPIHPRRPIGPHTLEM